MTSLSTISHSDLDKEDPDDASVSECLVETSASGSIPSTVKSKTSQAVLKKQAESMEAQSRLGTSKARPIPEMPACDIPKDPDKDSPNVDVSIEHFYCPFVVIFPLTAASQ